MPFDSTTVVAAAATPATNPSPLTLSTQAPLIKTALEPTAQYLNPAWTAQGTKAIFINPKTDVLFNRFITLYFLPSAGTGTTYTIVLWKWSQSLNTWFQCANNGTITYNSGNYYDFIANPGFEPLYIQLTQISAGSLAINCDGNVAGAF